MPSALATGRHVPRLGAADAIDEAKSAMHATVAIRPLAIAASLIRDPAGIYLPNA
jgi:hypothetical protein